MHRRQFLAAPLSLAGGSALQGDDELRALGVTEPRANSVDDIEPRWEQSLRITVGRKQADLVGSDHRVIQAAVDYVAGAGGGTSRSSQAPTGCATRFTCAPEFASWAAERIRC